MIKDKGTIKGHWMVTKYAGQSEYDRGDAYEVSEFTNLLLNSGINELWNIYSGVAGHPVYSNANTELGTGTSNTAAVATQTDILAGAVYNPADSGFPSVSGETITVQSTFASGTANQSWQEFVVKNSSSGICLNRAVSNQGTKTSGQIWVLTVTMTLS